MSYDTKEQTQTKVLSDRDTDRIVNTQSRLIMDQGSHAHKEQNRRDFLKKLGRYAAVTPPVVATLMTHQKATASSQISETYQSDYVSRSERYQNYRDSLRSRLGR